MRVTRPSPAPRKPEAIADNDEFFSRLFPGRTPPSSERAVGSGVIIDGAGYVLTAYHLFEPGDTVNVRLGDGRTLPAAIVGRDQRSGVGLLKIAAPGLKSAAIGDSRRLRPGERVFALGMLPAARTASVTEGIVSALEVEERDAGGYLQTTVSLHPAMGGGPLFNLAGEVVGVNAMMYSRVSGASLSFAIPVDDAMSVAKILREQGKVRRGTLGVSVQEVTMQIASTYGMDGPAGALLAGVTAGSPADRAGLRQGDIVLRYGGEPVRGAEHLTRIMAKSRPGERVQLQVRRMKDARDEDVAVTLGEAPN